MRGSNQWVKVIPGFALSIFVFFMALSGCEKAPNGPLTLGTNAWLGYEPLYLARHLNYWQPRQIHLSEYLSSSDTIRAFRNREIDAVALTLDEVLLLLQDGIDLHVILVTDISLGGDVILGRPGINSVADLAGLRVAVESTALGAYLLSRALEKHGLNLGDIDIVHQTANEHVYTFANDVADAVVGCEPEKSQLLKQGANIIFDSSDIPGEIVDVIAIRKRYLQEHPHAVTLLLKGWFAAVEYLRAHPEDAAGVMGKRMHMQANDVLTSLQGIRIPTRDENLILLQEPMQLLTTARKLNQIMLKHHLINTEVDIQTLPLVTPLQALQE